MRITADCKYRFARARAGSDGDHGRGFFMERDEQSQQVPLRIRAADFCSDAVHLYDFTYAGFIAGAATDQMISRNHFRLACFPITSEKSAAEQALAGYQNEAGFGRADIVLLDHTLRRFGQTKYDKYQGQTD